MSIKVTRAGIADVVASLPHMMGATPHDATVVVGLQAGRIMVLAQAYDEAGDITAQLHKAMQVMSQRAGCDSVLCAAYGMTEAEAAWSAECAAEAATEYNLLIVAQVHVEHELRMYSDEQGHWYGLPTVAESQLLAHEASTNPSPSSSRADLAAEWNRHGKVAITNHDDEPAMRAVVAILTGQATQPDELGSLAGWLARPAKRDDLLHVITRLSIGSEQVCDLPANIIELADAASFETVQHGLRRACIELIAPAATQLLTIAAAHSYARGNGMIARIQAEAAIDTGGNVRLTQLLLHAITESIRPPAATLHG